MKNGLIWRRGILFFDLFAGQVVTRFPGTLFVTFPAREARATRLKGGRGALDFFNAREPLIICNPATHILPRSRFSPPRNLCRGKWHAIAPATQEYIKWRTWSAQVNARFLQKEKRIKIPLDSSRNTLAISAPFRNLRLISLRYRTHSTRTHAHAWRTRGTGARHALCASAYQPYTDSRFIRLRSSPADYVRAGNATARTPEVFCYNLDSVSLFRY